MALDRDLERAECPEPISVSVSALDLFIVDDTDFVRECAVARAESYGLRARAFATGKEALDYLGSCAQESLPRAYLIDIKLKKNCLDLTDFESNAPEQVYVHLRDRGVNLERFFFYTGAISDHDDQVLQRLGLTEESVIIKAQQEEKFDGLLKELSGRSGPITYEEREGMVTKADQPRHRRRSTSGVYLALVPLPRG